MHLMDDQLVGVPKYHLFGCFLAVLVLPLTPASAELGISQMVVELSPTNRTADVEVFNNSADRTYVSIEPREIIAPGTPNEKSFSSPDPELLGILVSPRRIILEPRQRRTLRIAGIGLPLERERVYRVTVKPVVGEVDGTESGLKLLVGYDLLVLMRPAVGSPQVVVSRMGQSVTLTNRGNSSVELVDGKQCDESAERCEELPSKRLYAGASWEQTLGRSGRVEYRIRSGGDWTRIKF